MSTHWRALASFVLVALGSTALVATEAGVDFSFERGYGTYENVGVEAVPSSTGRLDVSLSSPENTVTLEAGSLRLEPAEDGLHKALLDVTFSGHGRLVAEIKLGGAPARFEDRVRFPSQRRTVLGWVSIEPVEQGYRVVTEQLPDAVEVEIESQLADGVVGFCKGMSIFVAGDAGCDKLETLLSQPRLPLPDRGTEYLVRSEDLEPSERERLDLYLEGARLMSSPSPLR